MKKLFFIATLGVAGLMSANCNVPNLVENETNFLQNAVSICNTQSSQDADGDNVSVTCCRSTYQEAFDCAARKLRILCMAPEGN